MQFHTCICFHNLRGYLNPVPGIMVPQYGGNFTLMECIATLEIVGNLTHEYINAPALVYTTAYFCIAKVSLG
jgi:hypothetical protein